MKHLFLIVLIALGYNVLSAQKVYLNVGRNFTTYDYTNSELNANSNIESSIGASYEMGYIANSVLGYKVDVAAGLTLDQYNASGGNMVYNYSWNTNYLGLQGVLKYNILESRRYSPVAINANAGVNFNHIISGKQKINGQTFDLTAEDLFNGLFFKHTIGLEVQYYLTNWRNDVAIAIGYNFIKNYGLSRLDSLRFISKETSGDENLNFNNRQLQFGILISIR
jgi:hypothetical protein